VSSTTTDWCNRVTLGNARYLRKRAAEAATDSVIPNGVNCYQCLLDDVLREHVAQRQVSILKKLTSEKSELLSKPSLITITHP